jgi:hypothetical protein
LFGQVPDQGELHDAAAEKRQHLAAPDNEIFFIQSPVYTQILMNLTFYHHFLPTAASGAMVNHAVIVTNMD